MEHSAHYSTPGPRKNMSAISIRAAKLGDLDAILSLERAVFATDRLSRRSLRAFIADPHRPLRVAILDKAVAGYGLVALRKGSAAARLYSLAVDPRLARRGVGRVLMAACERFAIAHGRSALRLEVRRDNAPAIALYERLGYLPFGQYDEYYADGAPALRFAKSLTAKRAKR
jgi:[ribosomal protein S18]-alanine N-acetyltransferase